MKARKMVAKLFRVIPLILILVFAGCGGGGSSSGTASTSGTGGTISLAWDASTTNIDGSPLNDLAGYKLYYGTASGAYDHSVDVSNATTYTLTNLTKGQTYYIVATAYDTSQNESGFSNEVNGAAK